MENILDRIKYLASIKRINISELERRVDLGNGTIRKWDKSLPSGDKLQKVAKYFGVTIDYLVNGEETIDDPTLKLARNAKGLDEIQLNILNEMIEQMKK